MKANKFTLVLAIAITLDMITTVIGTIIGLDELNPFLGVPGVMFVGIVSIILLLYYTFKKPIINQYMELTLFLAAFLRMYIVILNVIAIQGKLFLPA